MTPKFARAAWLSITALLALPALAQTLVVHPAVPVDRIERGTARAFFYMRLREWPDGTQVRVLVLGDQHPLHLRFCKQELGVLPHRLRRTWDRMVFAGLGQAPERVDSIEDMIARIASTPGAVGYLPEDRIDETVRTLTIE